MLVSQPAFPRGEHSAVAQKKGGTVQRMLFVRPGNQCSQVRKFKQKSRNNWGGGGVNYLTGMAASKGICSSLGTPSGNVASYKLL